ncbi:MAG: hypothetical protein ACYTEQ_07965 [Planctomycetota bacterium]|jgi:hypothetical protein
MRTLAHIINPVVVGKESDLFVAQPVTFRTMRIAKEFAQDRVAVELYSAQYPEDRSLVPQDFRMTPDLDRSILDFGAFRVRRKLPLIKDILDRLYQATEAEYLIYTNVDIALMPPFYLAVDKLIASGYDAFIINRRTISQAYTNPRDIPFMCAQVGKPHAGCDCLVFRRSVYPDYQLGTAFIGSGRIGLILAVNLYYHATKFKQFADLHLTFHIGNDLVWRSPQQRDYRVYNDNELKKILVHYGFRDKPPDDPVLVERLLKVYESRLVSSLKRKIQKQHRRLVGQVQRMARRIQRITGTS